MSQVSWPGKGLVVLHIQKIAAKGTHTLMPWMLFVPRKLKLWAFLTVWLLIIGLWHTTKSATVRVKGRKAAGGAIVSIGVDTKAHMPMKHPISREAHIKALMIGLDSDSDFEHPIHQQRAGMMVRGCQYHPTLPSLH